MAKTNQPVLKFVKLQEDTIIPTKEEGNAGYDIYANFPENYLIIFPQHTVMVPTKLGCIVPKQHYMQFFDRGSTGSKGLHTHCGVIDSNFRGELFVALCNTGDLPIIIKKDKANINSDMIELGFTNTDEFIIYPYEKAIVQGVLFEQPNEKVEIISKEEYENDKTNRGKGMLGSSNK